MTFYGGIMLLREVGITTRGGERAVVVGIFPDEHLCARELCINVTTSAQRKRARKKGFNCYCSYQCSYLVHHKGHKRRIMASDPTHGSSE